MRILYCIDLCQSFEKSFVFYKKSYRKIWWLPEKLLPLHPQSRERPFIRRGCDLTRKAKSSLRDLHRQNEVVQEAAALPSATCLQVRWVEWTNRQWMIFDKTCFSAHFPFLDNMTGSPAGFRQSSLRLLVQRLADTFLQWRVWSWLRMNASYRLNTCKSRGSMAVACNSWWRPAHGWVTRIQPGP